MFKCTRHPYRCNALTSQNVCFNFVEMDFSCYSKEVVAMQTPTYIKENTITLIDGFAYYET